MRVLGVDPGSRRIGLALSDDEGRVALPLETVERAGEAQAARRVAEIAQREGAAQIVVGLPLDMDGTEGPSARRARRFAEAVEAAAGLPLVMWDERLTTVTAERALRETGVRGRERKKVVDQAAATVLLQSYLDAREARRRHEDGWAHEEEIDAGGRAEAEAAARRGGGRGRRGR